jgi:acetyl-CoA carboxylase biotin carboxyl carrier protein
MNLKEIQNLIKFVAKSGASEVKLEMDDVKITIRTGGDSPVTTTQHVTLPPSVPYAQTHQPLSTQQNAIDQPIATEPETDESKYIIVKSPIIGTFYRRPSPDKPIFTEVGQNISVGDVLCIIEAMKLFNEIESEVSGKIVKILVDDASPVEFDQPLFLVDPS